MRPAIQSVQCPQLAGHRSSDKHEETLPRQSLSSVLDSSAEFDGNEEKDDLKDLSASQRRQAKNRAAQRRFRDRQKGRSQTLETLLALTTAELQQVKSKQQPLKARNDLLEGLIGVVTANNQTVPAGVAKASPTVAKDVHEMCKARGFAAGPDPLVNASARGPATVITVWDDPQPLTLDQVGSMNQPEFAHLYSEYARQLGACLLKLADPTSDHAAIQKRVEQLVPEFGSLMHCLALSNPENLKWCHAGKMDGSSDQTPHPAKFWADLLPVLQYTDNQVSDLLCLRRFLSCKLGQLARQRRAVLTKMTWSHVDSCHPSDKLSKLSAWAEQLQENGSEEYRTYMIWSIAVFRGVVTAKQGAIGIIYAYPLTNRAFEICEALAAKHGEPSVQDLLEDNSLSDAQHATNWEQVVTYTQNLQPEQTAMYNQFNGDHPSETCWLVDANARDLNLEPSLAEEEQIEAHLNLPWQII